MKKKDNKLYPVDLERFEQDIRKLLITAIIADISAVILLATTLVVLVVTMLTPPKNEAIIQPETNKEEVQVEKPDEPDEVIYAEEPIVYDDPVVTDSATSEEIELLALVTIAEAEGEPEEGKRLVIDTVLNRVDGDGWPNTIREVIYQPNQFVAMTNGRADRCQVTDEVRGLVIEELLSRTNSEVVYFTAGGYGRYGTPLLQVGNHYFCK